MLEIFHMYELYLYTFQVDVVFEEDKGFWAAVGSFMQNAKCPIIMTSNGKNTGYVLLSKVSVVRTDTRLSVTTY